MEKWWPEPARRRIAAAKAGDQSPPEAAPLVVEPGRETAFTLSAIAYLDTARGQVNSGFESLQVTTAAAVTAVDAVLVDDVPVAAVSRIEPGAGFVIDLPARVDANGTFLQVRFRATVYRDFTAFEPSAMERSAEDGEVRTQVGRAGDVDADFEGSGLVVRFSQTASRSVLGQVAVTRVLSPNGDGANDELVATFNLLRLLAPVPAALTIHALDGRLVARVEGGPFGAGRHELHWDGCDAGGRPVPPGAYLARLRVDLAESEVVWSGAVAVVF